MERAFGMSEYESIETCSADRTARLREVARRRPDRGDRRAVLELGPAHGAL